jgi:hypothetical protein
MVKDRPGPGQRSPIYYRLRSPVQWLLTIIVVVGSLAIAGMAGSPYLMIAALAAVPILLLAPSIGPYAGALKPVERTTLALQLEPTGNLGATESRTLSGIPADLAVQHHLILNNPGDQPAIGFNIRSMIPHTVAPPTSKQRLLTNIQVGQPGKHWFIEGTVEATVVTLRADPGIGSVIVCEPGESLVLSELPFPIYDRSQYGTTHDLEYQISGGTTNARLDRLRVQFPYPSDD